MTSCAIVESVRGKPDARDDVMAIGQPLNRRRFPGTVSLDRQAGHHRPMRPYRQGIPLPLRVTAAPEDRNKTSREEPK
jgi:hypothetical protein